MASDLPASLFSDLFGVEHRRIDGLGMSGTPLARLALRGRAPS